MKLLIAIGLNAPVFYGVYEGFLNKSEGWANVATFMIWLLFAVAVIASAAANDRAQRKTWYSLGLRVMQLVALGAIVYTGHWVLGIVYLATILLATIITETSHNLYLKRTVGR